jgi:hypothetical protein
MTVDGAIELIGAFLKETVRSPVLPGARVGVALSCTPAPSTVRWPGLLQVALIVRASLT